MNSISYQAFGDELTKIAVLGTIARGFGTALKAGWHGTPGDKVGKLGKGLTVLQAGLMTPGVAAKEDPAGAGRSRLERGLEAGGNLTGGLAGGGAGALAAGSLAKRFKMRPGGLGQNIASGVLGTALGVGGSIGASKLLSAPSRMMRERKQRLRMAQQPADPASGYET